jgi:hypothetical protein
MLEIRRDPFEPACADVLVDGDRLGYIEQLADGTWVGDITEGNGPPSKPYTTQLEAVEYVVSSWRKP